MRPKVTGVIQNTAGRWGAEREDAQDEHRAVWVARENGDSTGSTCGPDTRPGAGRSKVLERDAMSRSTLRGMSPECSEGRQETE